MVTPKPTDQARRLSDFTIVGIGASAGGVAALQTFLTQIPEDSGLAFVVMTLTDPDQDGHLAAQLQPSANITVQQITKTTKIKPNHVYVVSPKLNLSAIDTHLRFSNQKRRLQECPPLDHFFGTLAANPGNNLIGIILSGDGPDGALGIRNLRVNNGITIAQDPNEAEYGRMPQSALAIGLADLVLPLEQIPPTLMQIKQTVPRVNLSGEESPPEGEENQLLVKILTQIQAHCSRDFSHYKRATLLRRIARRMRLCHTEELSDYIQLLQKGQHEIQALTDDLLVTFTRFFHDQKVFEHLERHIIPQLHDRNADKNIRVWNVDCGSGEEAYSLAILFLEASDRVNQRASDALPPIQIFASDLHEPSLDQARKGFYPEAIEADVTPERLSRFFQQENGGYWVRKEVRELVMFASHDLLSCPPFAWLNLVVCRNLLTHLKPAIQAEVTKVLHYSLSPEGYLMLGNSETTNDPHLFSPEDKKRRLYRKRHTPTPELLLPVFPPTKSQALSNPELSATPGETLSFDALHRRMVDRHAPPSMLISPEDNVVHLSEQAGRYLAHPGGASTFNVFELLRAELRSELRATLRATKNRNHACESCPVTVQFDNETTEVVMQVCNSQAPQEQDFALIIFEERPLQEASQHLRPSLENSSDSEKDTTIQQLTKELRTTKRQLQLVTEKYDTSQEKINAYRENSEIAHEEFRSTREELKVSRKELQSMNEELDLVNRENKLKAEKMAQMTSDLQSLLDLQNQLKATNIATVFLDLDLRIQRFTPQLKRLFNIRLTDRGRPISDITHRLAYDELQADARQVLAQLTPIEREIQDEVQHCYLTRILPYCSVKDRIEGVVITFVNITENKERENKLRKSEEKFRALVEASAKVVWTTDTEGKVVEDPTSWRAFTGQTYEECQGYGWINAIQPEDREPAMNAWLQSTENDSTFAGEYRAYHAPTQTYRWTLVRATPLRNDDGSVSGWVGMQTDITERKQYEEALRMAKNEAEQAAQAKADFLAHMSHEIRTPLNVILGIADQLREQGFSSEQLAKIHTMRSSAEHLRLLVNDILDFSKIQAGKIEVKKSDVDLPALLQSLEKAHELSAKENKNNLTFQVDPQIPKIVLTDALKLSQILHNLISNAVKFTHQGTITVNASLHQKKGKGYLVTFSVEDTGIGIPNSKLATIFETFTQVGTSTSQQFGGSGLGLTITKLLLVALDSKIELESKEGQGSCFYFTLLLQKGNTDNVAAKDADHPPLSEKTSAFADAQILVVEDIPANQQVLLYYLKELWDVTPDIAENGLQAIEAAQKTHYDLVLMDIRMPEMDGYEAGQAIRELPGYAHTPILALTADTEDIVNLHADASLFQDIITKPLDAQELQQKLPKYSSIGERVPNTDPTEGE